MKYYVGVNAEATADELWRAVGDIPGDTDQNDQQGEAKKSLENK